MPKRSSKQKDPSEIARHVLNAVVPRAEPKRGRKPIGVRIAASVVNDDSPPAAAAKNPAAVALGRLGGKKGGPARAAKLSAARKKEIAQRAAVKRWSARKNKVE
jgi:hypothetical protein